MNHKANERIIDVTLGKLLFTDILHLLPELFLRAIPAGKYY